jgi:hypothetical protein
LGGRSEVLKTPVIELLGYTLEHIREKEEEAEREQTKYYLDFVSRLKAQKPENKEQQKDLQDFIKMIKPDEKKQDKIEDGQAWDYEAINQIKKEIEGG